MPQQFTDYLRRNADRIYQQRQRGTLPYFLRDNPKLLERLDGKAKSDYIRDKEFGERLQISTTADKTDLDDNIRVAKALLNSFPDMIIKIRPHSKVKGDKNPELEINGLIADNKKIESERGIANAFGKALKQGCTSVVIDLDAHVKRVHIERLSKGISDRKEDFKAGKMLNCFVVFNDKAIVITTYDRNKIREILSQL